MKWQTKKDNTGISSKTMLQHIPADKLKAVIYEVFENRIISGRLWSLRSLDLKDILFSSGRTQGVKRIRITVSLFNEQNKLCKCFSSQEYASECITKLVYELWGIIMCCFFTAISCEVTFKERIQELAPLGGNPVLFLFNCTVCYCHVITSSMLLSQLNILCGHRFLFLTQRTFK